jgi:hypothetical protein
MQLETKTKSGRVMLKYLVDTCNRSEARRQRASRVALPHRSFVLVGWAKVSRRINGLFESERKRDNNAPQ